MNPNNIKNCVITGLVIFILTFCFTLSGVEEVVKDAPEKYTFVGFEKKGDIAKREDVTDHQYAGWQMACNYAKGSNGDWNEKTQTYNNQEFLDCANGNSYVRINY